MKLNEAFVYIWTDNRTRKFYIGSHKGTVDDGYICSSKILLEEYYKRPTDFTRRIIKFGDESSIRQLEAKLLQYFKVRSNERFYNENENNCSAFTDFVFEKYGVHNAMQHPEIKEKHNRTNIERYGYINPLKNEEIKAKAIETIKKRYGVENVLHCSDLQSEYREKRRRKHGIKNTLADPEVQDKIRKSNLDRYGVENVMQVEEVKIKMQQTNIEKYGHHSPFGSKKIQKNIRRNIKEKYGVDNVSHLPEVKNEIRNSQLQHRERISRLPLKEFYEYLLSYKSLYDKRGRRKGIVVSHIKRRGLDVDETFDLLNKIEEAKA